MTFPILLLFDMWALVLLRVVVGLIFTSHGFGKLKNPRGTGEAFQGMGFRPGMFWGPLVGVVEVISGLALILGFFTQVAAALLAVVMLVAFFWKLSKRKGFSKMEIDLVLLAASLVLVTLGGGAFALDRYLPQLLL